MKPYFSCLYMFLLLILLFSTIELSVAADSITPATSVRDGQTLVSPSQRFELGFFSPGNSESRYVGIWYKVSPGNVAWVANRNNPIPRPGAVLTVTANGDLVLLNQTNGTIWSININREAQNPVAQLLDTGNLVVRENSSSDSSEDYLWQSFDYPSDTLLPGMRLGWYKKTGRQRYLTSWVSPDDPSPGSFTYRLDIQAVLPQICFYNGSAKLGCAGPWNGEFFGAAPTNPNYVFSPSLVDNEDEIYYMYDSYNDPITMMLKSSLIGKAQRIIWNERTSQWDLVVSFPEYFCEHYGSCGANNFCSQKKTPNCECLKGFTVKSEDNQTCVRSGNDSDCRRGDSFLMYNNTKLPDMQEVSLNKSSNLKDCEAKCLKNCTCRAYATSNVTGEGSGCLMWFGDLTDFREAIESTNGVSIYVRVPASEPGDKKLAWIAVVVVLPLVLLSALYIFCRRRRQLKEKERGQVDSCQDMLLFDTSSGAKEIQEVDRTTDSHNTESWFPIFSFASVSAATDNFSVENKLGEGGFGPVYKGRLLNGEEVAVKRLSANSGQGLEEFRNEMMLIAKLQHRNLVRLFGCCVEQGEKILVYEYLPNNSLDLFLFDPSKKGLLDWETRVRIIDGIAQGLLYLHQYSRLRVIHRDLKASNILLDSDMNAKISDFGMARMFDNDELQSNTNRIVGTYGYMSPEYALQGHFSIKSDVFSFGVLLLEILSGKKNTRFHDTDARTLVGHAWDLWKDDRARVLMDPILESAEPSYVTLKRYINVALLCVQDIPADRPTMSEAVSMLKNEIVHLPFPQRPAFSCARILENSALAAYRGSGDESFSLNRLTISVMDAR